MHILDKTVKSYLSLISFILLFTLPSIAVAEKITLQLKEGNLTIEGELISFDGKFYTIQSDQLGQATFEANRFICIDGKCPKVLLNPFEFHDSTSDFNIRGSNTIGTRLMPWIIRAYARSKGLYSRESESKNKLEVRFSLTDAFNKTETNINLYRYGSSTAFPALLNRKAVIGTADRRINDKEIQDFKNAGIQNIKQKHEHPIGIDGIVVIVSPRNPVSSLTLDQLADIFSGNIKDWSQVGGSRGKIKVIVPGRKSGTYSTFNSLLLKPRKLKLLNSVNFIDDNETLSNKVSGDENAIGITSFAYIDKSKPLGFTSKCGLITRATPFHVQTGEYPLSRRLYLYTSTVIENKHAVGLLNFARSSPEMNSVLNIAGFIGKRMEAITFNQQKERIFASMTQSNENFDPALMRQLLSEFKNARRLSYTARFEAASSELNLESRKDFNLLVEHLKTELKRKNYIIVTGFADTKGAFQKNALLSHKRASIVKKLIANALGKDHDETRLIVRGFGELLPSACNDTEEGREANRRVEIWVVNEEDGKKLVKNQTFKAPPPLNPPALLPDERKSEKQKPEPTTHTNLRLGADENRSAIKNSPQQQDQQKENWLNNNPFNNQF